MLLCSSYRCVCVKGASVCCCVQLNAGQVCVLKVPVCVVVFQLTASTREFSTSRLRSGRTAAPTTASASMPSRANTSAQRGRCLIGKVFICRCC